VVVVVVVVVVGAAVVVGARVVVVGGRVVVVVVVVVGAAVVVVVVVGTIVTAIVHEPPDPSLAFSLTPTEPLPDAPPPTLMDTVAVQAPPPSPIDPPPTMLAPATFTLAPSEANAALLELKLTVTERDSPWGMLTDGQEAVASAAVAPASTNPTAPSRTMNAITIG
jgi:hypothetical protein